MDLELLQGQHFIVTVDSICAQHGIVCRCVLLSVAVLAHSLTVVHLCRCCCPTQDVLVLHKGDVMSLALLYQIGASMRPRHELRAKIPASQRVARANGNLSADLLRRTSLCTPSDH